MSRSYRLMCVSQVANSDHEVHDMMSRKKLQDCGISKDATICKAQGPLGRAVLVSVSHTGEHVDVYAACSIASSGKSLPHIPRRPTQYPAEMPTMSSPDSNSPSPSGGPSATDLIMYIGMPLAILGILPLGPGSSACCGIAD
ncbi:hypothetical protein GE21DRAFT_9360 [Neurospora crassa]|uniref:Uncharacterized protein n=1 Tax=Neurospora crassa (strain ATCC 24698 / 74-OR23-1A / CBS 708.71 / DSM 1257 / FGSC 987) TaxID=367110 RepID=Q7S215_NEUCR|nr:hypothetical protein NCU05981 [Neurospora crassa OR74A]EAA29398.1 hypothetical protein NCU05981 [Neurospora crassa OR74A]KHE87477.1 hypothetical protein GE21DRAFT_9360 [Neurospora crassa]|eukprot:XP_958634.1 hypothetical protein NCU05981 [Neurospora crassa OR74A]